MTWPIRWDLLTRYRLIEIIAQWEGRLISNHLMDSFGIGRQQASKDINSYLTDIAPGNLVYDKKSRGYTPSPQFSPKVSAGSADEYLHALARIKHIQHTFETLDLGFANTEMLQLPLRQISPLIIRPVVQAARENRWLEIAYASISSERVVKRFIVPHTLVCTPLRWHLRAYCKEREKFLDFVLTRFRDVPTIGEKSQKTAEDDTLWQTEVCIRLEPNSRLTEMQRDIVQHDFAMVDGRLELKTRAALASYLLHALNINTQGVLDNPLLQQVVVANREEIQEYLF